MTDPELLTAGELDAMRITADLANALGRIVGDGRTRNADLVELVHHVHQIQHAIMSQAAARAYPDRFRQLGQTIGDPGSLVVNVYEHRSPYPPDYDPDSTRTHAEPCPHKRTTTIDHGLGEETDRCIDCGTITRDTRTYSNGT